MAQSKQTSFSDLLEQMNALKDQLTSQAQERVDAIKAELNEISQVTGKSIPELLGISAGGSSTGSKGRSVSGKSPAAPKYKHPEQEGLTWTGRGRQPRWYSEFIEAGGKEEDLLIDA